MRFPLSTIFACLLLNGVAFAQKDSPIIDLTRRENVPLLKQALARGENPDAIAGTEGTALHIAAKKGNLLLVLALIEGKATVDSRDHFGWTPLMVAAADGFFPIVQVLQEAGADVNAVENDGISPLMWASANGHMTIVKYLIRNGAEINAQDKRGRTALNFVQYDKGAASRDIYKLLRKLDAKPGTPVSAAPLPTTTRLTATEQTANGHSANGYSTTNETTDEEPIDMSEMMRRAKEGEPVFLNFPDDDAGDLEMEAPPNVPDEFRAIEKAMKDRRFDTALEFIETGLAEEEDRHVRIYYLRMKFFAQHNMAQNEKCAETLNQLKELDAHTSLMSSLAYHLAHGYQDTGDDSDKDRKLAEQYYLMALTFDSDQKWRVMRGLARLYQDWDRHSDALRVYRKALSLSPPNHEKQALEQSMRNMLAEAPPIQRDQNGGLLMVGNIDFKALRGKVVILINWRPTDSCSMNTMEILRWLHRKHADDPFMIISFTGEDREIAEPVIKDKKFEWNHLWEYTRPIRTAFEMDYLSTVVMIDQNGQVIYRDTTCSRKKREAFRIDARRAIKRAKRAAKEYEKVGK